MAKKTFKIRAKVVFDGEFSVRANDREDAEKLLCSDLHATIRTVGSQNEHIQEWRVKPEGYAVINRKMEEQL